MWNNLKCPWNVYGTVVGLIIIHMHWSNFYFTPLKISADHPRALTRSRILKDWQRKRVTYFHSSNCAAMSLMTTFVACHSGHLNLRNQPFEPCIQRKSALSLSPVQPACFVFQRVLTSRQRNCQQYGSHAPKTITPSASALINRTVLNTSLTAVAKLLVTLALGVAAAYRGVLDPQTLSVSFNIFIVVVSVFPLHHSVHVVTSQQWFWPFAIQDL